MHFALQYCTLYFRWALIYTADYRTPRLVKSCCAPWLRHVGKSKADQLGNLKNKSHLFLNSDEVASCWGITLLCLWGEFVRSGSCSLLCFSWCGGFSLAGLLLSICNCFSFGCALFLRLPAFWFITVRITVLWCACSRIQLWHVVPALLSLFFCWFCGLSGLLTLRYLRMIRCLYQAMIQWLVFTTLICLPLWIRFIFCLWIWL